jgi:hypothetical protein
MKKGLIMPQEVERAADQLKTRFGAAIDELANLTISKHKDELVQLFFMNEPYIEKTIEEEKATKEELQEEQPKAETETTIDITSNLDPNDRGKGIIVDTTPDHSPECVEFIPEVIRTSSSG